MKQGLKSKEIQYLRGLAHKLDPVVLIGQHGVTAGVVKEIEQTLNSHELIKVKIRCDDQEELGLTVGAICDEVKAVKVQVIGHTAVFYRESKEPKIKIPGRVYASDPAPAESKSAFKKKAPARGTKKKMGAGARRNARDRAAKARALEAEGQGETKTKTTRFPKKRTASGEQRKTRLFH